VDRITRKELKTDRFALEVEHTVEYVGEHKKQMLLFGGIGLAVLLIAGLTYWYMQRQHAQRQSALYEALRVQDATVGPGGTDLVVTFPTQDAKNKAVVEAMNSVANKYPGSEEATIARYYIGVNAADQGKLDEAEKAWKQVADSGEKPYGSLAKFSLADLYEAQGKRAEAEKLLRELIQNPTVLVTKEQATISLARVIARSNPAEARKLLEPLRTERSAVSRAAISALSELPATGTAPPVPAAK
jgi:predicted negative regulator of RcsB-dependent stress response